MIIKKDGTEFSPELIRAIRESVPRKMAEDICSVQPLENTFWTEDVYYGNDEKWLKENGYEPVEKDGQLLWIKKDTPES